MPVYDCKREDCYQCYMAFRYIPSDPKKNRLATELRRVADRASDCTCDGWLIEAANEIERLEAIVRGPNDAEAK